jgi:4-amino-4-deoxy-L-arabinose transferase-like glycosyltransferase
VLAGAAVLLFPTIYWPFDYDQGTFAYGGSAILNGERPYIDFWDIKPPNIFYTYATAFAIFGKSVRAVRIFDYLNALLCIGLLFVLAKRLWKNTPWRRISAIMASLTFVLQYYILGHWDTAQAETYALPFLLGSLLLVIPQRAIFETRRLWMRAALAGACVGVAFYFKFPNALFLALVAAGLWTHSGHDTKTHVKALTWMLAGFAFWVGAESLFLAAQGELVPLWNITMTSTSSYVSNNYSGSFTVLDNIRTSFHSLEILWLVMGILGWSYWATENIPGAKHTHSVFVSTMLMILGSVLAFIIVQLQNKGFTYHYTILLPWADLLIGAGIGHVARALSNLDTLPRGNNAAIVAVLLLTLSFVWTSSGVLHQRLAEFQDIWRGEQPANGYVANDSIVNYVESHTKVSDRIFIFGFAPYVYWKTGRKPATKYLNTIHFKPTIVPEKERQELVTTLVSNPPQLFLVEMGDRYTSQGNSNDDSRTAIALRYPELEKLLAERYTAQDTVDNTIAFHLRR